jgi:hypothetical protein
MSANFLRFSWTRNPMHMLPDPEGRIRAAMARAGVRIERLLLSNMNATKRWQNRTGDLAGSMTSKASVGGAQLRVQLTLNEYYGRYVETRWGGRYESVWPTLQMTLPEALQITIEEVMRTG